ncbi:hypothetical protein EYZ11_013452 [Aspergillus tanneri]|uniref:Uncharacterized protein n=1 Tax=Aspergillus tanneri TaxID=1220188 RepID=A0A4S3J319_9EURO|nr:hypothetical protein EYZ11_013452 [Aspergillus tanneri]
MILDLAEQVWIPLVDTPLASLGNEKRVLWELSNWRECCGRWGHMGETRQVAQQEFFGDWAIRSGKHLPTIVSRLPVRSMLRNVDWISAFISEETGVGAVKSEPRE